MSGFRLQSAPTAYQVYHHHRNGELHYPRYLLRTDDGRLFGTHGKIGSYATTTWWLARTAWDNNDAKTFQFVGPEGTINLACVLTARADEANNLIVNDAVYVPLSEGFSKGVFDFRSQFAYRERYIVKLPTGESVLIGTELDRDALRAFWLDPVAHSRNKTVLAGGELMLDPFGEGTFQFRLHNRLHTISFENNNPVIDGQHHLGVVRTSSYTSSYTADDIGYIWVEVTIQVSAD